MACKAVLRDEMAVPPHGWRVPYVVVNGPPGAQLRHLVRTPEEVLKRGSELRVNYLYYMSKCINPALDRVLSLCGAEVFAWFKAIARPKLRVRHINYDNYTSNNSNHGSSGSGGGAMMQGVKASKASAGKQTSMDQFTMQGTCEVCGAADARPLRSLCTNCSSDPQQALTVLMLRLQVVTQKEQEYARVCQNCAKSATAAVSGGNSAGNCNNGVGQQHSSATAAGMSVNSARTAPAHASTAQLVVRQNCSVLYARNEMVGPDACESLDCGVFFERARLVTRLEDLHICLAEIE